MYIVYYYKKIYIDRQFSAPIFEKPHEIEAN